MRRAGVGAVGALLVAVLSLLAACSNELPPEAVPAAPAPPPQPMPATPEQGKRIVVGVDDLGTGFNPHLASDISPVSTGVASLVLPSVFRPGPDGARQLDTTVVSSVKVASTAPFTVSYEINLAAAWSDNAPIAAEDFVYLWQRMRSEPGVVNSAGYRMITEVRSRAGGKAVDVVFAQPYPQWQTLFDNLLPAHLLKDAPRSWATALAESIPSSGGPFVLSAVDRARGQLVLARNDHYWSTPAVVDSLLLRRVDANALADGLRGTDMPLAQVGLDPDTQAALAQLGQPAKLQPVAQPIVVQLGMRTDSGVLADQRVRQAVGALLNRDTLIKIGTANGLGGVRADAQLLAPSERGYHPTAPAGAPTRPDPVLATHLLNAAGYARDAQGRWNRQGQPLTITVGAPADRPRFSQIAEEAARQLEAAGVQARAVTANGSALLADPTVVPVSPPSSSAAPSEAAAPAGPPSPGMSRVASSSVAPKAAPIPPAGQPVRPTPVPGPGAGAPAAEPSGPVATPAPSSSGAAQSGSPSSSAAAPAPAGVAVDLQVMPRGLGADLATSAVSNYGCPPGMAGVATPARNSTGFCLLTLQPTLDALVGGALSPEQAAGGVEATLWAQLPAIPLFQPVTTLVTVPRGDELTGGVNPGPLTIGPLGTAGRWQPSIQ